MNKIFFFLIIITFFSCQNKVEDNTKIRLMKKEIDLMSSQILFADTILNEESLTRHWDIKSGEWKAADGWYEGKNPLNAPGMIVSKEDYFGDVMIEFESRNVLPSSHDIDVMVSGSWNDSLHRRDTAYVAGLQGWWEGKVGIERSPEYTLNAGTPLFGYEPGHIYHIIMGNISGHIFIWADGKLLMELTDPDPIDVNRFGKVGFEAYASWIQVRNIKVRRISWKQVEMKYEKEFE